mmetsp:Transcript_2362/g.3287  ORF Transcript_2362/g.3287 Transcript_2362/m.3287 type:complete len:133 (-) Transcript_2362:96-494(-)
MVLHNAKRRQNEVVDTIMNYSSVLDGINVRSHAQTYSVSGCVLVGDSAHTINPLAGQGVNIGFKDEALLEVTCGQDLLSHQALRLYEQKQRPDNPVVQSGMDIFYEIFSNDLALVKLAINAVLKIADNAGPT